MTFAKRLKNTAVVHGGDPKKFARRCRVHPPCGPFAPLAHCPPGIAPIDALALRTFVPAEIGATVSVRGGLSLDGMSTTAMLCGQKPGTPYNCCNHTAIRAFVGDIPNGARLEGMGCVGDESQLCCSVPAFGQEVVATGKISPETDAWLVSKGTRWRLENATLCTRD
ncbi:MAG TPA: hypothetical protein VLJ38_08265 [Polyangiaceae bacterium]|nr:hypothetical protein [Polyangiaceae bacterium]